MENVIHLNPEEPARVVRGEDIDAKYAGMDIVESPSDVDYDSVTPKPVSAAFLNQFAGSRKEGRTFMMKLHQTSINVGEDVWAEVKIVNVTDRVLVGTMPTEVRKLIERLFFSGNANTSGSRKNEVRMQTGLKRLEDVGYAYGCAGFVKPRLVLRQEDVRDPDNEVWVGSGAIALHDLTEFSRICEGDEQLARRRLEGFSE